MRHIVMWMAMNERVAAWNVLKEDFEELKDLEARTLFMVLPPLSPAPKGRPQFALSTDHLINYLT